VTDRPPRERLPILNVSGRKRSDAAKKAARTRAAQKHARELYERDLNAEPEDAEPDHQRGAVDPSERWIIHVCTRHGFPVDVPEVCDCIDKHSSRTVEEVEVVPATPRGAVDPYREALRDAIKAARLFNRSGMTWLEYDAELVRLERIAEADHPRGAVSAEVERVLADDEAMRRAVRAEQRSPVGGRTALARAIRAAFDTPPTRGAVEDG